MKLQNFCYRERSQRLLNIFTLQIKDKEIAGMMDELLAGNFNRLFWLVTSMTCLQLIYYIFNFLAIDPEQPLVRIYYAG